MEKPDRNSLEYAAYKAQKRAYRDAKKLQREAETENLDFRGEEGNSDTHHRRGHHSRSRDDRRRRRKRSSSRARASDEYDDDDDDEGESYSYSEASDIERFSERRGGAPHRKSRSRAGSFRVEESPSRRRRPSASPDGLRGAPSSSRGRERSDSDLAFGGGATYGANANTNPGYGPPQPGAPPPQGAYAPPAVAATAANVGGGYGGGGGYGEDSRHNPASPPITAPGSPYPAAGMYGSEQPSSQQLPPPLSPGAYAQDYPQNPGTSPDGTYYSAPPPATTYASTLPTPQRYPDGAQPPPSGDQYPAPPPPSDGGQYPPPGPGLPDKFTPGQGQAALQSMTATPSVFQYQTEGPDLGATPAPYSGDPKLDPNYPSTLPSGGAGNAYPPNQGPPQYNSPDYYANDSRGLGPQRLSEPSSAGTGLVGKLGNLTGLAIPSMSGPNAGGGGGGGYRPGERPPPSPALQPYYGTYQSISPLPSPTFPASRSPLLEASGSVSAGKHSASGSFSLGSSAYPSSKKHDKPANYQSSSSISSFQEVSHTTHHGGGYSGSYSPSSSSSMSPGRSRSPSPERRRSYNPMSDAKAILEELKHTFTRPSPRPLINILPTLSPRDLQSLRREYKSQYRGVNLAKHIKSVFTTSSPFGKVVFAVALGPYESEAWFANSWYQRKETRNELLIEALMGKSNSETASIKAAFRDAKYDSSLEKAVSDELPANKFRIAVMAQLSCSRMDEDRPLSAEGIREDVSRLGSILERGSSGGGETEMVGIVVTRSDRWLREVAALYRQMYGKDLAKAIMRHSKNLVGETLLHILNGLVDKPLRDAKLLDQAITAVTEQNREDLLISRATRIHWDEKHLRRVKFAFKKKYRVDVGTRIKDVEKGSYLEFLLKMMREDDEYGG